MTAYFVYLLEVIACSALFAGCYWLVLRNGRFYHWNRFYILASVALSVVIPALNVTISTSYITVPAVTGNVAAIAVEPTGVAVLPAAAPIDWAWLGWIGCMSIVVFLFAKEVVHFIRILRLKRRSERIRIPETVL